MTDVYRTPGSGAKTSAIPPEVGGRAIAMTPGEHYVMAEGLLEELQGRLDQLGDAEISYVVAIAQVHATLATVDPNRVWPRKWLHDAEG